MRGLLIPIAFFALSVYTYTQAKALETSLYFFVGTSFLLLTFSKSERFEKQRKLLTVLSWVAIAVAVFLFIAVLRQDAYSTN